MSRCAILVDSACDPTHQLISQPDIFQMGMTIKLDGKEFIDGQNLEPEAFYASIDKVKDFRTTPPLVWDIKKQYEQIKRLGYDSIISIHVSSRMSKLIETCENAANMVNGVNVSIIDTQNISIGAYLVAEKVIELIQSGRDYSYILKVLPKIQESSLLQISLSTLKYLVKNKKVGRVQGMVGNVLRMKPVLGIDKDGYLTTLSKERGGERVSKKISENALSFIEQHPHNVKFYLTWGFDKNKVHVEQVFKLFMNDFKKLGIKNDIIYKNRMRPTIACNSGPGAYGLAIYGEKHPIT